MPRIGVILETSGDRALLSAPRRGICEGCAERGACGVDAAGGASKPETLEVLNPLGARSGDLVEFDLPGHTELRLSLVLWVLPLAGLVAGAASGAALHEVLGLSMDGATLLGAVLLGAMAFLGVMAYDRHAARDPRCMPRVQRILRRGSCPGPTAGPRPDTEKNIPPAPENPSGSPVRENG